MTRCRVEGCEGALVARGLCRKHYGRWYKYGDPLVVKQHQMHGATVLERWESNVQKSSGCWEWSGYRDENGYGRLNVDGVPVLAHRLSWTILRHELTPQQHVLHRCDNPPCVRPEHLFLGDQSANVADMWAKKRQRYGVSRGMAHGCSKLNDEQVREIRLSTGPSRITAETYGISGRQVRDIRAGKAWRHLT